MFNPIFNIKTSIELFFKKIKKIIHFSTSYLNLIFYFLNNNFIWRI